MPLRSRPSNELGSVAYRKKMEREIERALIMKIEGRLPPEFRSKASGNAAGPRSIGSHGRTLVDVLADTIRYVKFLRGQVSAPSETPSVCATAAAEASQQGAASLHKTALFNARMILCIELDIDESAGDWTIKAGIFLMLFLARLQCWSLYIPP